MMGEFITIEWLAGKAYIVIQSEKTKWQLEVAHALTDNEIDQIRDLEEQYNQDLNQLLKDILDEASKFSTK